MKIVHQDPKKGSIKLRLQTMDDCWHLFNVLEKGDHVGAVTQRTKKTAADKIRAGKEQKETVYLTIEVESLDFQKFSDRLRIHGVITEGPYDQGSHHSFNITMGSELTITKEWTTYHQKRLQEAVKMSHHPRAVIISLDDDDASIAVLHQYGVEEVATIASHRHGKFYESPDQQDTYYGDILAKLQHLQADALIVVGPGFAKENLLKYGKTHQPDLFKKSLVGSTGNPGMTGVTEALNKGIIEKIVQDSQVARESRLIEDFLAGIATDRATYGATEVEQAVVQGAVSTLIITHHHIRAHEDLLRKAEGKGAEVHIISGLHEAGEKLDGLGGIGAFLRYKL